MVGEEREFISSSEIERYGFCPLSWWLSRKGIDGKGEELELGKIKHQDLSEKMWTLRMDERKSKRTEYLIGFYSILAVILAVLGILMYVIYFFRLREKGFEYLGLFFIIALVWLLAASFFFYVALRLRRDVMERREEYGVPEGEIEFTETLSEDSQNLVSEKYGINGKPDYIVVDKDGNYIPVEIKTGRVPKGPLFSHILQLASYCLLVEERYNKAPPYGILEYEDRVKHKIEYTENLKNLVVEKVNEMRKALVTKNVHRNHNRPGKCKSCSRRDACPERLK